MLALTRRVAFTAGHIYRGGGLTREELDRTFGVAADPSGHGHNYVLEVTVEGNPSPRDGMVVNIKDLDDVLKKLLAPIDHRMINEAWPEFADRVPTTECLAQSIWKRLPDAVGSARKVSLKLEEHPGMYVSLDGKEATMVYLTRSVEFAAAHRLHAPDLSDEENLRVYGKCNNPNGHGHNYIAEITVKGEPDPRTGVIVNLGKLEDLLKRGIDERFDHKHLNLDTPYFKDRVATAENIAIVIWELLAPEIGACRDQGTVELHRVRLIETARSWFDYYGAPATA